MKTKVVVSTNDIEEKDNTIYNLSLYLNYLLKNKFLRSFMIKHFDGMPGFILNTEEEE